MNTKVAILGAGCSCDYGYPLANQTKAHIVEFGKRIESSAPKLHKMTLGTLDAFDKLAQLGCPAQTLDELAWFVHQKKLCARTDMLYNDESDLRVVDEAKTVISAMFLAKERDQPAKMLAGYRNFMKRIFPNATRCGKALEETPWRILTFNYDRLFELAFCQHFPIDRSLAFYGEYMLNSGLYPVDRERVEINTSRFSLLKLHGSAGFFSFERYGQCNHLHMVPDLLKPVAINDETFIFGEGQGHYSNRPIPSLIIFPHEKDHLKEFPGNKLPFRIYIPEILRAASEFVAAAEEVHIIGYSLPESDWASLEGLLNKITPTCRVVVHNPDAVNIVSKIQARLPALTGKITGDIRGF